MLGLDVFTCLGHRDWIRVPLFVTCCTFALLFPLPRSPQELELSAKDQALRARDEKLVVLGGCGVVYERVVRVVGCCGGVMSHGAATGIHALYGVACTLVVALRHAAAIMSTTHVSCQLTLPSMCNVLYPPIRHPTEKELSDLRQSLGMLHGAKSAAEVGRGRAPEA